MQIFRDLAGYSFGRADIVRRAMAKKKHDVMEKEREIFVEGSVKNGVPEKTANVVFDEMAGFASYAFNKSHAAAYSLVAYQTAYLKRHYFKEYMAALMTSVLENTGKLIEYISGCESAGVKVLSPDINESMEGFASVSGGIRFALLAVKGVGRGVISGILEARRSGAFVSIQDFCRRMQGRDFNKRAFESLIKCGAFDSIGYTRHTLMENYEGLFDDGRDSIRRNIDGQMDFFGSASENTSSDGIIKELPEYPDEVRLKMEKEITGIYISGHPLDSVDNYAAALRTTSINSILSAAENGSINMDGKKVLVAVTWQGFKLYNTKNDSQMAFTKIEDKTGEMECIVFPEVFKESKNVIKSDESGIPCFVSGKISVKDEEPKLLAERIFTRFEMETICKDKKLYIKVNDNDAVKVKAIMNRIISKPGKGKLIFCFEPSKRKLSPTNISGINIDGELLKTVCDIVGRENIFIELGSV